ncbi:MAG: hypothetical protein OCC49_19970 [Fibrobacterales bacterium]
MKTLLLISALLCMSCAITPLPSIKTIAEVSSPNTGYIGFTYLSLANESVKMKIEHKQTEENFVVLLSEKAVQSTEYSLENGEYLQTIIAANSDSLTIVPLPAGDYIVQSFRIQQPGGLSSYRFGSELTFVVKPGHGTYIGDYRGVYGEVIVNSEGFRVLTVDNSLDVLNKHDMRDSFTTHITPIDIVDETPKGSYSTTLPD